MPVISAKEVKDPNDLGGKKKPDNGKYHVAITSWDESQEKHDAIIVGFVVLDGTVPGMKGREWTEFFNFKTSKGEDATDRIVRLCLVTGLIQSGQETDEDFTQKAVGRQLVVEVEGREYTNSSGEAKKAFGISNFGYSTWAVTDPLVVDVPKSASALKNAGKPQQQPPQGGQASGGKDEWGDV
mgnify:CR=1 FL=1